MLCLFSVPFSIYFSCFFHVRENCLASGPRHDPPCRVAVDRNINGYNNVREVDKPNASSGKCMEKCGDTVRVKPGAVKHGWDGMKFKIRTNFNPTFLSHVHTTRKIACVARERCVGCGVLFTLPSLGRESLASVSETP